MLSKTMLIGRLTRPPSLEYTPSGTAVCKFGLATNKKIKGEDKTEFHNIVTWAKTAELCGQYLTKGSLVYLEGENQTSNWEKDGVKHYKTEVNVFNVQFLSAKGEVKKDEQGKPIMAEEQFASSEIPF